jgi:hypothetical protein
VTAALDILVQKAPFLQTYLVKTASREASARKRLTESEGCTATGLYMAMRTLYGVDFLHWEPETIWLTLEHEGITLPLAARDKVLAAMTLQLNPAFYWDHIVFQNTVQALNGEHVNPEAVQECHPAHIAWAVKEAAILRGLDPHGHDVPEFDEDVQLYVAVCLKRAGLLIPPDGVDAEEIVVALDKQYGPEAKNARDELRDAWRKLPKTNLQHTEFAEDPLGVQLAQLSACHVYVEMKAEEVASEIHDLSSIA